MSKRKKILYSQIKSILIDAVQNSKTVEDISKGYKLFKITDTLYKPSTNWYKSLSNEQRKELIGLYGKVKNNKPANIAHSPVVKKASSDQTIDQAYDSRSVGLISRCPNNSINHYEFNIKVHNNPDFKGNLSREDMEIIYSSYSSTGKNMTCKEVSKLFSRFTLSEFKKILRAFNITKASSPFAPHQLEERDENSLVELQHELTYYRVEKKAINTSDLAKEKQLLKMANELYRKSQELNDIEGIIKRVITNTTKKEFASSIKHIPDGKNTLMLNLTDLHIGAMNDSSSLWDNNFNLQEVHNRYERLLSEIGNLNYSFDTIIINILGDMIDGSSPNATSRNSAVLPQNIGMREMEDAYISTTVSFVDRLLQDFPDINIKIYSVPCGNHGGYVEMALNKALMYIMNSKDRVSMTVGDKSFLFYTYNNIDFCLFHGKDENLMRRNFPLNMSDSIELYIHKIAKENGYGDNHLVFLKGDLHQYSINYNSDIKYVNCPSMFGSSSHSQANYGNQDPMVHYSIIKNNNIIDGIINLKLCRYGEIYNNNQI